MVLFGRIVRQHESIDVVYQVGDAPHIIDILCLDNSCYDFFESVRVGDELVLELGNRRELTIIDQKLEDVHPAICRVLVREGQIRHFS